MIESSDGDCNDVGSASRQVSSLIFGEGFASSIKILLSFNTLLSGVIIFSTINFDVVIGLLTLILFNGLLNLSSFVSHKLSLIVV
jgi:hypothetical protein